MCSLPSNRHLVCISSLSTSAKGHMLYIILPTEVDQSVVKANIQANSKGYLICILPTQGGLQGVLKVYRTCNVEWCLVET